MSARGAVMISASELDQNKTKTGGADNMKKTNENIHRTCINYASDIEKKLIASEAEVARLREALRVVADTALDTFNRVAVLGQELNALKNK